MWIQPLFWSWLPLERPVSTHYLSRVRNKPQETLAKDSVPKVTPSYVRLVTSLLSFVDLPGSLLTPIQEWSLDQNRTLLKRIWKMHAMTLFMSSTLYYIWHKIWREAMTIGNATQIEQERSRAQYIWSDLWQYNCKNGLRGWLVGYVGCGIYCNEWWGCDGQSLWRIGCWCHESSTYLVYCNRLG